MSFVNNLQKALRANIRDYGMFIALIVIMFIFTITTNGIFISSRNISNLLNQTGYLAVLAIGMTLIIVIRHIDLSVGFLSGFIGAVTATAMTVWGWPIYLAIPLALLLGIAAGSLTGFMVAVLGISGFVASLAGFMAYRGAILLTTMGTGTIIIKNNLFNAIGNGYIPDIPFKLIPGFHNVTLILGVIAIILFIAGELKSRRVKQEYNFEVLTMDMFVLKLLFISALISYFIITLAQYNGISWTVVVVLLVLGVYQFLTNRTILGRHIYALGGNPEAAELSGINVKKIQFFVFGSMGMLSAICGILFASRLQSATTTAGTLFELDAIAATFVGGTSTAGGIGKVTGSLIGALVIISLTNGMNIMSIDISVQYIVRGIVLAVAVIFDVATRARGK
ncbi:MAG: sugar ABC transporter permease [Spirochaetota bacterium]